MVRRIGFQIVDAGMVGEHRRLAVEAVGVGPLDRRERPPESGIVPQMDARVDRLGGGGPGDDDRAGRVVTPGQMDLLRRAVRRGRLRA